MSAQRAERMWARVTGRVQGVGFRAAVRDEARRLRLRGWVRNAVDGTVELEAEGGPAELESLLQFLARGPVLASVANVERRAIEPTSGEHDFRVRW